jgi:beta-galactosidase
MKFHHVLIICTLTLAATIHAAPAGPRIDKTINRDWVFQHFPNQEPDSRAAQPDYDDSKWPAIALPHTWNTYETTRDLHLFIKNPSERDDSYWWYGWGWYRKRFTIGTQYASRLVAVEFDGVQKYAKVYLNGLLVGEHKGGYTGFSIDVTRHVKFDRANVLAVQVSNRREEDSLRCQRSQRNFRKHRDPARNRYRGRPQTRANRELGFRS